MEESGLNSLQLYYSGDEDQFHHLEQWGHNVSSQSYWTQCSPFNNKYLTTFSIISDKNSHDCLKNQ